MYSNDRIRHEPEEKCSILTSFVVGIQGIMLVLPPAISVVVVTALAANQDEEYLTWAIFAALMIMAIVTALQASRIGRLGSGHMVVTGVTPNYIALAVLALAEGGPAMLASLMRTWTMRKRAWTIGRYLSGCLDTTLLRCATINTTGWT